MNRKMVCFTANHNSAREFKQGAKYMYFRRNRMPTLLQIDSSPMGNESISRQLTEEFARLWLNANPQGSVITRDLTATAIPPVSAEWVAANYTPEESRTADQKGLLTLSAIFTGELLHADEYVIGVPVHNWGPTAKFKLWVDHFITPFGPTLHEKRATFIITAGRFYGPGSGNESKKHVEPWLRTLFGGLGVTDVRFVFVQGTGQVMARKMDRATFLAPHVEKIHTLFEAAVSS